MIDIKDLEYYNTEFEIGDIFGRGRMKELIFDMKERLCFDKAEIEKWQQIAADEAKMIGKLYERLEAQSYEQQLRDENEALRRELQKALEGQTALQEYADSLQKKLDETHLSDVEAYRILKSMQTKKNWIEEEVS